MFENDSPEVRIHKESPIDGTDYWYQEFTLYMPGDPARDQIVKQTGKKIDLGNPKERLWIWQSLKHDPYQEGE